MYIVCKDMALKIKTEWMDVHLEILKNIKGYEFSKYDKENGVIDYLSNEGEKGLRLIKVFVDDKLHAEKVDLRCLEKTMGSNEDEKFDQVTLLAEGFTNRSRELIQSEEFLSGLTESNRAFNVTDIHLAVQNVTQELCIEKCGSYPQKKSDCKGIKKGVYACDIRRISDDADFHAQRGWKQLLYGDYKDLLLIKRGKESARSKEEMDVLL